MVPVEQKVEVIIPARTLSELSRLLTDQSYDARVDMFYDTFV